MTTKLLHAGYHKTYEKVLNQIATQVNNMTTSDFKHAFPNSKECGHHVYVSVCRCQLQQPQVSRAPLKPIIAKGFLSRLLHIRRIMSALYRRPDY